MIYTALDNFYLNEETVENSPSRKDGIDRDTEINLRIYGCELIQEAGILLGFHQAVMATGQVLFHRFYCKRSMKDWNVRKLAATALWLGAKLEEVPDVSTHPSVLAKKVVVVVDRICSRRESTRPTTLYPDTKEFLNLKDSCMKYEREMLRVFGFITHVDHPHKIMLNYCHVLSLDKVCPAVIQEAWNLLNDSLRTTLCVRYKSNIVACGVIFMAARRKKVPLPENPPWWRLFDVQEAQMFEVVRVMHELFLRPKAQHIPVCRPTLAASKPGTPGTPSRHQDLDSSIDRLPGAVAAAAAAGSSGGGGERAGGGGTGQRLTGERTWPRGDSSGRQQHQENGRPGTQVSLELNAQADKDVRKRSRSSSRTPGAGSHKRARSADKQEEPAEGQRQQQQSAKASPASQQEGWGASGSQQQVAEGSRPGSRSGHREGDSTRDRWYPRGSEDSRRGAEGDGAGRHKDKGRSRRERSRERERSRSRDRDRGRKRRDRSRSRSRDRDRGRREHSRDRDRGKSRRDRSREHAREEKPAHRDEGPKAAEAAGVSGGGQPLAYPPPPAGARSPPGAKEGSRPNGGPAKHPVAAAGDSSRAAAGQPASSKPPRSPVPGAAGEKQAGGDGAKATPTKHDKAGE